MKSGKDESNPSWRKQGKLISMMTARKVIPQVIRRLQKTPIKGHAFLWN